MKKLFAIGLAAVFAVLSLPAQSVNYSQLLLEQNASVQFLTSGVEIEGALLFDRQPSAAPYGSTDQSFYKEENGHANALALSVYPNPTVDNIWIKVIGPEMDFFVTLYNSKGQLIGVVNHNLRGYEHWETNFNLSNLEPGTYILLLSDVKGKRLAARRFIKQY